jgi:hypothetical protein
VAPILPDRVHISNDDAFDMGHELEAPPTYREFGRPPKYEEGENVGFATSDETVEQAYLRDHG